VSAFDPSILRPGDAILDMPDWWNPIDDIISLKTWTKCCHVRVYVGGDQVVQAILKGVDIYNFDPRGIGGVLEPVFAFDLAAAMSWFYSKAQGQKYDVAALFRFFSWGRTKSNPDRMICSEFATRFYRAGTGIPFNPDADADMISPAQFTQTSGFRFKWRSDKMPV
jgi:hypothetical protein